MSSRDSQSVESGVAGASALAEAEWFCAKLSNINADAPVRVLCFGHDDAVFEKRLVDCLQGRVRVTAVVTSTSARNASLPAPNEVAVVDEFSNFASEEKFDVVTVALYSIVDGSALQTLEHARQFVANKGVFVVWKHPNLGLFDLRKRLHEALARAQKRSFDPSIDPDGTGTGVRMIRDRMSDLKLVGVYEELVDSQVDLSRCVDSSLTEDAAKVLENILRTDMAQLRKAHPQALGAIMGELCDMSLYADVICESVVVYCPLVAIVGFGIGCPERSSLQYGFRKYEHSIFPSGVAQDRCNDTSRVLDDPPVGKTMAAAGGGAADAAEDTVIRVESAVEEPWYPCGADKPFFNMGLKNWQHVRNEWNDLGAGNPRPEYPPPVDIDQVAEELMRMQREFRLPGPMRLPDLIDLYVELWEEDDY